MGGVFPVQRVARVLSHLHRPCGEGGGVKQKQTTTQRVAHAGNDLEHLQGLERPQDAWQDPNHATFCAARHQARRGRGGKQVSVVGPPAPVGQELVEHRGLSFKPVNAGVHVHLAFQHACIVDEVAGWKVVRPVRHDVVLPNQFTRVVAGEFGVVHVDFNVRVQRGQPSLGGFCLGLSHGLHPEEDLALQVAGVDRVEVHHPDASHAGCGQVEKQGGAQPARSNHQDAGGLELALPFDVELGNDEVPAVALELLFAELHVVHHGQVKGWNGPHRRQWQG